MTVSRKRVKGVEGKGSGMQAYQLQSIKPINRALIVHFVHIILHKSEVWSTQARLPVDIVAAEAASRSDRFCFSSSSSSSFFFVKSFSGGVNRFILRQNKKLISGVMWKFKGLLIADRLMAEAREVVKTSGGVGNSLFSRLFWSASLWRKVILVLHNNAWERQNSFGINEE